MLLAEDLSKDSIFLKEEATTTTPNDELIITEEKPTISKVDTDNTQLSALGIGDHLLALFVAMRPRQWTKNLALFIGLVFAQQLFHGTLYVRSIFAFITFVRFQRYIYF